MTIKHFHIGDVLSVTTGDVVVADRLGGLYGILKHLCGEDIHTHQLPRVIAECRPKVLAQHPQLASVSIEGVSLDTYDSWLADIIARYGETLPIESLAPDDHLSIDPITEALDQFELRNRSRLH